MDPKAQAHFSAQAQENNKAKRGSASYVKKKEFNTAARIPRENAARTQRAKVTHRREGKEKNDKRTGARLSTT